MRTLILSMLMLSTWALAEEKEVARADVPPAVIKAVEAKYPGATLAGFSKEVEHGKTSWEVNVTVGTRKLDVELDSTGAILEVEEKLTEADLPEAVKKALAASAFAKAKVNAVEKITKTGKPDADWELQVDQGGKKLEVVFAANGKLVRQAKSED